MRPILQGFLLVARRLPLLVADLVLKVIWRLMPLAFALVAYSWAPRWGITPLKPYQIALLLDEASTEVKVAVVTAAITVAGFLIAFRTAHSAWRAERVAELRIRAGDEIFDFAQTVYSTTLALDIDLKRLMALIDMVHKSASAPPLYAAEVQLGLKAAESAEERAQTLRAMSNSVFALDAKFQSVVGLNPLSAQQLPEMTEAVAKVGSRAVLPLPSPHCDGTALIAWCQTAATDAYVKFLREAVPAAQAAVVNAGSIRGVMLSAVVRPTLASVVRVAGHK